MGVVLLAGDAVICDNWVIVKPLAEDQSVMALHSLRHACERRGFELHLLPADGLVQVFVVVGSGERDWFVLSRVVRPSELAEIERELESS